MSDFNMMGQQVISPGIDSQTTPVDTPEHRQGLGAGVIDFAQEPPVEDKPSREGIGPGITVFGSTISDQLRIRDLVNATPGGIENAQRIEASFYLADLTGMPESYVYSNLEDVSEQFFGSVFKKNTADIMRVAYHNSRLDIQIGRLMSRHLAAGTDERTKWLDEAMQIETRKVQDDPSQYNIGHQIIAATGNFLPYMIEPIPQIAAAAGTGLMVAALAKTGFGIPIAASLAGSAAKGATIGRMAGSLGEISRIMSGMSFYQMLQEEDEDGNQIPLNVARYLSIGSGVGQGVIGALQFDTLTGGSVVRTLWQRAVSKTLTDQVKSGFSSAVALGALRRYGSNYLKTLGAGVAEEMMQESVAFQMHKFASQWTNNATGANIPVSTQEQFLDMLGEVAKNTAMGLSLISIPGAGRATIRDMRQQSLGSDMGKRVQQSLDGNVTQPMLEALNSGDMDRFQSEYEIAAQQAPVRVGEVDVSKNPDGGYVARVRGMELGTYSVDIAEGTGTMTLTDVQNVLSGDLANQQMIIAATEKVIADMREQRPDLTFRFDPEDENQMYLKEAIENQIPEMRKINENTRISESAYESAMEQFRTLDTEMERARQELDQGDIDEAGLADITQDIEQRSTEVKEEIQELFSNMQDMQDIKRAREMKYFETREGWAITTSEFINQLVHNEMYNPNKVEYTPDGIYVKKQLREALAETQATDTDLNLMITALEFQAHQQGKTFKRHMMDTYAEGVVVGDEITRASLSKKLKKAALSIFEDGRVLIEFSENADFGSFMHEFFHVSRRLLNDQDLNIVAEWAGQENPNAVTWDAAAEERVVSGILNRISEKESYSGPIADVLLRLRQFFDKMAEMLLDRPLNDDVRRVFDRMIGEQVITERETDGMQLTAEQRAELRNTLENNYAEYKEKMREATEQEVSENDTPEIAMELFQPMHEQEVQQAVETFQVVPDEVLNQYRDREWAQKEIARREYESSLISQYPGVFEKISEAKNFDEFMFEMTMGTDMEGFQLPVETLTMMWEMQRTPDVNAGNQRWVNSLSVPQMKEISFAINKGVITLPDDGSDSVMLSTLDNSKKPSKKHLNAVRGYLRNNATHFRREMATKWFEYNEGIKGAQDSNALRRLQRELLNTREGVDQSRYHRVQRMTTDRLQSELKGLFNEGRDKFSEKRAATIMKELDKRLSTTESERAKLALQLKEAIYNARNRYAESMGKKSKAFKQLSSLLWDIESDMNNPTGDQKFVKKGVIDVINEYINTKESRDFYMNYTELLGRREEQMYQRRFVKEQRQRMKNLVNRIKRMTNSQSIDVYTRQDIQLILGGLDPHFRSKKTKERRASLEKKITDGDMTFANLDSRTRKMLFKSDLSEFSIDQIEDLYNRAAELREYGTNRLRELTAQKNAIRQRTITALVNDQKIDIPESIVSPDPGVRRESARDVARGVYLSTLNAPRLADIVDGMRGFQGANHYFFVTRAEEANKRKIQQIRNRRQWVVNRLNELGYEVTERDMGIKMSEILSREVGRIGDTAYSLDQVLDIYAGFKNAKKKAAIVMGNGRERILSMVRDAISRDGLVDIDSDTMQALEDAATQNVMDEFQGLADMLSDDEKRLADMIIDEYAEHYNRLEATHAFYQNESLGFEENYTPIRVMGEMALKHEAEVAKEILVRRGYRMAGLDRSFTIDRARKVPLKHRKPVQLGLLSSWETISDAQEHYMAFSEWNDIGNQLFSDSNVGETWRDNLRKRMTNGDLLYKQLEDLRNRIVTPQPFLANQAVNKVASTIRNRTAIGFLAGNMVTVFKQIPSVGFYMVDAGPIQMMASIAEFMHNPAEFYQKVRDRNPALYSRAMDRDFAYMDEMMRDPNVNKLKRDFVKFGMGMIRMADNMAVSIGEEAVYQSKLNQGLSPEQAAREASNVTLRTQPVGAPKDMSKIFTTESLYLFTQFSNQLNQIWNMITHDSRSYLNSGMHRQFIMQAMALSLSSYMIWALTNRQAVPDTEDPKQFVDLALNQAISSIPIIGSALSQASRGFASEIPTTAFFTSGVKGAVALKPILDPNVKPTDAQVKRAMNTMWEFGAFSLGLPVVAPRRVFDGALNYYQGGTLTDSLSTAVTGGPWTFSGEE